MDVPTRNAESSSLVCVGDIGNVSHFGHGQDIQLATLSDIRHNTVSYYE